MPYITWSLESSSIHQKVIQLKIQAHLTKFNASMKSQDVGTHFLQSFCRSLDHYSWKRWPRQLIISLITTIIWRLSCNCMLIIALWLHVDNKKINYSRCVVVRWKMVTSYFTGPRFESLGSQFPFSFFMVKYSVFI